MVVDLHNHTPLCNHATGTLSEYIEAAIKQNTQYFGIADHAPMDFDPQYRMSFSQMQEYENSIVEAKQKYALDITLLLGYEVDFIEGLVDKRVLEADVDYLIGSVHFLGEWGFDNPEFIGRYKEQNIDDIWQKYFAAIESMAKTKQFQIAGHLDLMKVFKFMPTKPVVDFAKDALLAIKEANMALELNVAGYRKPVGEPYPSRELLEEALALNIPITFASDAHEPKQVGLFSDEIVKFAKDVGYKEAVYFESKKMKFIELN